MPSSRKRNKGRDRKAKKAALEAEQAALEVERMERERGIVRKGGRVGHGGWIFMGTSEA